MFFEQYSHEPHIAVARFIRGWTPVDSPRRASELPRCLERGQQALAVMEKHLAGSDWFTGPAYGIADIALFAYTRSEEHTSELQSLMRNSYAVFCLKKKK